MAKGKHAAALFEVIHADRRFGKKTPPSRALSTPKWWFKGKAKAGDAQLGAAVAPASPAPVQPATQPIDYMPAVPGSDPTARPVDMKVNPDRQEISFRLTYNSAIVGGFALVVLIGLTYLIGRKMSSGPTAAVAAVASTSDIRKGKPQPTVLDLQAAARNATTSIAPDRDESAHVFDPTPARPAAPANGNAAQTTVVDDNPNRSIGLNYVVIQSFRYEQKDLADEAVKQLQEAGIGATVVKDVPGWAGWYSVVGTRGFDRTKSNPQYDAYVASIMDVSPKFAGKSKWKSFAPQPKKWAGNP
ncbi:MAG: hypothetical protein WBD40_05245 [Tepidisphaeraceae bacterium]